MAGSRADAEAQPRLYAPSSRHKAPGCVSLQPGVFRWLQAGHPGGAAEHVTGLTSSRGQATQPTTYMGSCLLSAMPHYPGLNASHNEQLPESPPPRCAHGVLMTLSFHTTVTQRYLPGCSPTPPDPASPAPAPQRHRGSCHQAAIGFTQQ